MKKAGESLHSAENTLLHNLQQGEENFARQILFEYVPRFISAGLHHTWFLPWSPQVPLNPALHIWLAVSGMSVSQSVPR